MDGAKVVPGGIACDTLSYWLVDVLGNQIEYDNGFGTYVYKDNILSSILGTVQIVRTSNLSIFLRRKDLFHIVFLFV